MTPKETKTIIVLWIFVVAAACTVMIIGHPAHAGKFKSWCARHIIADDPHEFEEIETDTLTRWVKNYESRIAWMTLYERLDDPNLTEEQRANIMEALKSRPGGGK